MKKQTFRAKSMTEAVEVVKRAMGPDAVIISVRNAPSGPAWKVWQSPGVEVIAVSGGKGETISPEAAAMLASELEAEASTEKEEETQLPKHLGTPDKKAVNRQAFQAALRRSGAGKKPLEAPPPFDEQPMDEIPEEPAEPTPPEREADEFVVRQGKMQGGHDLENEPPAGRENERVQEKPGAGVSPEAHEAAVQAAKLITQMAAEDPKKAAQLGAFLKKKAAERSAASERPTEKPQESRSTERETGIQPESRPEPQQPVDKIDLPLTLNTPKPKLALDELASALRAPSGAEANTGQSGKTAERPAPSFLNHLPSQDRPIPSPAGRRDPHPARPAPAAESPEIPATPSSVDEEGSVNPPKQKARSARPIRIETPLSVSPGAFIPSTLPPYLAIAYDTLLRQGVDAGLLEKTVRACAEALSPQTLSLPDSVQEYMQRILEGNLRTLTSAQLRTHSLICIIGPSGVGKTSFTAKLAVHCAREKGGELIWISADTVRTGAIAETRMFGDLLGVHQFVVYTPEELEALVRDLRQLSAEEKSKSITILVDTPACNPYNETDLVEMGAFLNALPGRATYLTVPATAKEADLVQIHSAYGIFKIDGLVVTKMDETRTLGGIYNLAWRSQIPLTYFTKGVRLLEDLLPADARRLCESLFRAV